MKPKILIIDDELQIRRFLRISLESQGYQVEEASTGEAGMVAVAERRPDLIILDMVLPDDYGLDVLRRIREWSRTPVIILSVQSGEEDKIACLDAGADDYLTKPFGAGELYARIRTALRHAERGQEEPVFRSGRLSVDLVGRVVRVDDREVHLTSKEYELLRIMIRHPGRVITHRQLLTEVWGEESAGNTQYLRIYMAQLRKKIEPDPSNPEYIITESGVGYRFRMEG
jgi:two-component system KDP operon response regulator KdpE